MLDIAALAALCELAIKGGNKALEEYKKRKYSNTEKELLIAAAKDGKFHVLRLNEGDFIKVGNKNFPDDESRDLVYDFERYYEAFESLCKRGFIRYEGGELFILTRSGFDKARQLVAK
jgi:hypothetical protein